MPQKDAQSFDIFDMLSDNSKQKPEKPAKTQRQELLEATKYKDKDLYPEGTITINPYTCVGVQCKLCIKACPTNALYWTNSGIQVIDDLCLHCEACVLSCMVDDCIKVTRKREDGKTENFSNAKDVAKVNSRINVEKRRQRIEDVFRSGEEYIERYSKKPQTEIQPHKKAVSHRGK